MMVNKIKGTHSMCDNQPLPPTKRIQAREAALKKQVVSDHGTDEKRQKREHENVDLTG